MGHFDFYSPGLATCLGVTMICGVRYHVHVMAGVRRAAHVMVRVTSGSHINQSEWLVPGTVELDA